MFAIALGQFDLTLYSQNSFQVHPEVGTIFIWIFIIVQNITLLNFVIAILSNTYSIMLEKSEAVYLKTIIDIH